MHVPRGHTASVIARQRAGWLRCRVIEPEPGSPSYSASPTLRAATAFTIGGTVAGRARRDRARRALGLSEGVPGQAFGLAHGRRSSPAAARRRRGRRCRGLGRVDRGGLLRRLRPDATVFRVDRPPGEVRVRSCGARPRRRAAPLRRGAAQGRPLRVRPLPHRRRPAGNVAARRHAGAARRRSRTSTAVENRRPGARRRRRRDRRGGEGARPADAAHARPRRDRRGLRAARPRGRPGHGPGALRAGRRRRRRWGRTRCCVVPDAVPDDRAGCGSRSSSPPTSRWPVVDRRPRRAPGDRGPRSSSSRRSTRASRWSPG